MELVLTGLDIDAKADWVRRQVEAAWAAAGTTFESVDWSLARTDHEDAPTEEAASARLRVTRPRPVARRSPARGSPPRSSSSPSRRTPASP